MKDHVTTIALDPALDELVAYLTPCSDEIGCSHCAMYQECVSLWDSLIGYYVDEYGVGEITPEYIIHCRQQFENLLRI